MALKTTFDTDEILYGILKNDTVLASVITGGVYTTGARPVGSEKEDVVVNTITLTQEYTPQRGVSNVNIHVSDIDVKISGANQKRPDSKRLKALTGYVLDALRGAKVAGLEFVVTNQNTIREAAISQHFVNLRIEWNIH
jgi:hypothetical protein